MATIIGTIGDDNLSGGSGDDLIYGYDPADQANTDGGNDTLNGAGGNDSLFGGNGNDILNGGTGIDSMTGGLGDDVYYADQTVFRRTTYDDQVTELPGEGNDTVFGYVLAPNVENLMMLGYVGRDNELDNLIIGNDYSNTVYAYEGKDTIALGKGNDRYYVSADDIIIENAGEGTDRVYATSGYHLAENVEELYVSGVGFGNELANIIYGYGLSDRLMGGGGDDQIFGGYGDDTLIGDAGNDLLWGGAGYDTADYSGSDHALTSAGGKLDGDSLTLMERILGSSFDDTFDLRNNTLSLIDGGAGNDRFIGGDTQPHTFWGGAGNDTFTGGNAAEIFVGGTGNDSINGGGGVDTADYSAATTAVTVNLGLTGPQNTGTGTGIDTLSNIENLTGSDTVRDNLTGNGLDNLLLGLSGNDVLAGGAGNDTLDGGNSNDTLNGDAGDDTLDGGNSNDTLNGDAGDDRLIGGGGTDVLEGGTGNDLLLADAGDDRLAGGDGIDTANYAGDGRAVNVSLAVTTAQDTGYGLDTLSGIENLIAGAGNDRLVGSTAANVIRGGAGNDGVVALGGADSLYGENGDDILQGGAGNDLLVGGAGADQLVGGADADTFLYNSIADTGVNVARDTINDFQVGLDHVDLSVIDANVLASGDQAFSFIGSVAFSHAAAQLRQAGDGAGNTIIEGDVQGDGIADFQIVLNGAHTLTSSSFIL